MNKVELNVILSYRSKKYARIRGTRLSQLVLSLVSSITSRATCQVRDSDTCIRSGAPIQLAMVLRLSS
jgi:hypothetical protein